MALQHRPEIDGLRAIAVVSVIVYHLKLTLGEITLLPGGFLGVDLFFVISGFLIARLIISEVDATGRLNLAEFYRRRARRIIPPLILVILVSLPAAWLILMPSELERFAASLAAALFFFSNIFWFFEQGSYGASSALLQPFLHMWSLAIEEQFYLVFPLAFLLIARSRFVFAILCAACLSGFVLAVVTTEWRPHLSFYSPVSRAWELLAGVCLAWASLRRPAALMSTRLAGVLPSIGLGLIVVPIFVMPLSSAHPGLPTLPVICGTCLIIWFARPGEWVTNVLSSAPMTFIGALSYSLYLWHYPIFAFGRHIAPEPGVFDMGFWLVATLSLSYLGYRLVEKPFRYAVPPWIFAGSVVTSVALVMAFTSLSLRNEGYAARFGALAEVYAENEFDNGVLREASWSILDNIAGEEKIGGWNAQAPSNAEISELWFTDAAAQNVLLVGNSHSKDLFNALHLNRGQFPGFEFARFGIGTDVPEDQVDQLLRSPNFSAADIVLVTSRYHDMPMDRLPDLIERIKARGKTTVLLGNTPEFEQVGEVPLFDWYMRKHKAEADLDDINRLAYEAETGAEVNRNIAQIAVGVDVPYVSRRSLICDDNDKVCTLVTPDARKAMYDEAHWTLEGAAYFGGLAARSGWFASVLGEVDHAEIR